LPAVQQDTINITRGDALTVSGGKESLVFQQAFGRDVINGFAATDTIQLSKADFANWSALLNDMSQSGSNTVITLDALDAITLTDVRASSLQSSQFHFV
jgi:Ca2+-binding RTX toxin-like protein